MLGYLKIGTNKYNPELFNKNIEIIIPQIDEFGNRIKWIPYNVL